MASTVDVKAFIDQRPISTYQWFLVVMCFVTRRRWHGRCHHGVCNSLNSEEWDVSRPAFGIVISIAPFGLVIGALAAAPPSDRFGRKPVLI
jgi:AAHS family 4-hydroxybenzoate transporter-like MFS transporter